MKALFSGCCGCQLSALSSVRQQQQLWHKRLQHSWDTAVTAIVLLPMMHQLINLEINLGPHRPAIPVAWVTNCNTPGNWTMMAAAFH
jgi:hypothetical protein